MGNQTAGRRGPARKLDRAAQLHVTLPEPLADRLKESAVRLHVSRSLLAREAIERGIKPATDALRAKVRRLRAASADVNGVAAAGRMTALVWFGIGFAVCWFLRARVARRADPDAPAPATTPRRPATRTSTGTGRAVLGAMRAVNDMRALSRGPGAYGKRVLRRSVFRSIRKW